VRYYAAVADVAGEVQIEVVVAGVVVEIVVGEVVVAGEVQIEVVGHRRGRSSMGTRRPAWAVPYAAARACHQIDSRGPFVVVGDLSARLGCRLGELWEARVFSQSHLRKSTDLCAACQYRCSACECPWCRYRGSTHCRCGTHHHHHLHHHHPLSFSCRLLASSPACL